MRDSSETEFVARIARDVHEHVRDLLGSRSSSHRDRRSRGPGPPSRVSETFRGP